MTPKQSWIENKHEMEYAKIIKLQNDQQRLLPDVISFLRVIRKDMKYKQKISHLMVNKCFVNKPVLHIFIKLLYINMEKIEQ